MHMHFFGGGKRVGVRGYFYPIVAVPGGSVEDCGRNLGILS